MKIAAKHLLILGLTVVLGMLPGCRKGSSGEEQIQPVAVRVVQPVRTTLREEISYLGTVKSVREVRVISRVQGTILSMPIQEGQKVRKGQTVVRILAPELEATVQRLQAEVDYWSRRYEADQRLEKEKAIPPEQVAMSRRAYLSAKAALQGARANLDKAVEKAPFNGEMLKWLVDPGQPVMPGQPILILGDNRCEAQVEVIEEDLRKGLRVGMPVIVQAKDGKTVQSTVKEIAPQASGASRTFLVKIPLPQSSRETWRKGESVQLTFVLNTAREAVAVPVEAIADRDNQPHIFLIRDGKAYRQDVSPGIQEGNLVAVDFPYNGTDLVAITNLGLLKDSIPVFAVQTEEMGK